MEPGWTSIIPALLAVILAFITREAVISLALACVAGVILMGQGIQGFPALVTRALGNEDFVWICCIELCIGILIAFFQRSGAVDMFSNRAQKWATVLSSLGGACDHMDHVKTQLPYALVAAAAVSALYILVGITQRGL